MRAYEIGMSRAYTRHGTGSDHKRIEHGMVCVRITSIIIFFLRHVRHIIVGAWSMAVTLWQRFEYYYY